MSQVDKKKNKIGIIGYGNMGSAIAERIKKEYEVYVFDKDNNKTAKLRNIKVAGSAPELIAQVDTVILAVKPQDFDQVLKQIKGIIDDKLVISIAAGVSTRGIEKVLGKVKVVRVMPNIAARIGKGISFLSKGRYANRNDLANAFNIFKQLGKDVPIINEDMMPVVTAGVGSFPGFWGDIIERNNIPKRNWVNYSEKYLIPELTDALVDEGINKKDAGAWAYSVTSGTIATVNAWNITPSELKKKVASKKGTTEAGLKELNKKTGTLKKAVKAALKRAKELFKH